MRWPDDFPGFHVFAGRHELEEQLEATDCNRDDQVSGARLEATFGSPGGLVETDDGTVFVADVGENLLRRIDTEGNVTTFVDVGHRLAEMGMERSDRVRGPIECDPGGNLFVLGYDVVFAISKRGVMRVLHIVRDEIGEARTGRRGYSHFQSLALGEHGRLYVVSLHVMEHGVREHELYRYTGPHGLASLYLAAGRDAFRPSCVAVDPDGRLWMGGTDEVVIMSEDGSIGEQYVSLDVHDPVTGVHCGYNTILDIAFDPSGHMYLAGNYSGPFRVDADTQRVTRIGDFPLGNGCSCVHVKRRDPYKGHLLVCTLDTILVSDHPVYPPNQRF